MRKIVKDYSKVPATLSKTSSTDTRLKCVTLRSSYFYQSSVYGHQHVRTPLETLYHGKCAYCEKKIRPVATPEIEHYRPKGKINGTELPGYYWLGYEWSNLLLACPACNGIKSTKFPLDEGSTHVSHPVNGSGAFDDTACCINHAHYAIENPLILNPELPAFDPSLYLEVNEFGELEAVGENALAKTTIEEIGLNRQDLIAARQTVINDFIIRIEDVLCDRYAETAPLTDVQFTRQLERVFEAIIGGLDDESEFTLLGKHIIEDFEDFILEELDEPFRAIIRNEFIRFLGK